MGAEQIAVLMTCHNRRSKTLACLDALMKQTSIDGIRVQVYLVDDGCTDGTGEAVREQYPQVNVLQGNGRLYWCGGMRAAFAEAMKGDYDYYLWLNDDTHLYPHAVYILLETSRKVQELNGRDSIIVGAVCDPDTGQPTYGGAVRLSKWRPLGLKPVEPQNEPQRCDTMNGNCVLIPRAIARTVGNLSSEFTHWIGDTDYGLRATKKGYTCWVAPGFVGTCRSNLDGIPWADPNIPLRERLKILNSPKGLPPHEWTTFVRRHAGILWPYCWLILRLRAFFPKLWVWLGK